MPKVRPSEQLPAGFEKIAEQLDTYEQQMRDAVADSEGSTRKRETNWPIARINYARTRYVFLMHKRKEITDAVVSFCIKQSLIDPSLIGKWKLPGYERLCCSQCVNQKNFAHASGCLCRVPLAQRKAKDFQQCATCGCAGCSSADKATVARPVTEASARNPQPDAEGRNPQPDAEGSAAEGS